ncbi:hypothetical protein GCM10028799_60400 [Kribbella italica]
MAHSADGRAAVVSGAPPTAEPAGKAATASAARPVTIVVRTGCRTLLNMVMVVLPSDAHWVDALIGMTVDIAARKMAPDDTIR